MQGFSMRNALAPALALVISLVATAPSHAVIVLSAMPTWGNGDGWRAPNEIVTGDGAGTATGSSYNFLGTGSLERGIAYNPVTGNVYIASRSAAGTGQGVRILNGTTGADIGVLGNSGTGTVTGGLITMVKVGVGADGAIYVNNAQSNVSTTALKVYRWASEGAAAPTTYFNSTISGLPGTPRVGDTMDVTGSGANTRLAFGNQGGTNMGGYAVVHDVSGTPTGFGIGSFTPALVAQAFNRGITFAGSSTAVWGRGQDSVSVQETTYTTNPTSGTVTGSFALVAAQQAIDYITIQNTPYLAVLDHVGAGTKSATFGPIVRIYNATNPTALTLVATGSTVPNGTALTNAGGLGQIAWGATTYVNDQPITTLYAMAANQGIQAFTFQVDSIPEVSSFLAVGLFGLAAAGAKWYRRTRTA